MSRVGNFTSSSIHQLMSKGRGNFSLENTGKPFDTYIKNKLREIRVGREINNDVSGRAAIWGKFMEGWVFTNKLDINYNLVSRKRFKHPTLNWSGMPDTLKTTKLSDIKNPYTINSFCDTVDSFISLEVFKKTVPEYYWQLISNYILAKTEHPDLKLLELIVHVPYLDELESIRDATEDYMDDPNEVAWIRWSHNNQLPYIQRDLYYKDLNKFIFEPPEEDIELLTKRVEMANTILIKELKL